MISEQGAGLDGGSFVAVQQWVHDFTQFDAFDAQLRRMVGFEDGISDALFRFTRSVSGSYFWCPPMLDGVLDLRTLGA